MLKKSAKALLVSYFVTCAVILVGIVLDRIDRDIIYEAVSLLLCYSLMGHLEGWEDIRVVCHIKSSLAPKEKDFAFKLDPMAGFQWVGPIECLEGREQGLAGATMVLETGAMPSVRTHQRRRSKQDQAETYLCQWLAEEVLPCAEVHQRFRDMGISVRTVAKAKKLLQIHSVKRKDGWYWS